MILHRHIESSEGTRWRRTCLICLLFSLVNHPLLERNLRGMGNKRLIHNFEFILLCHQSIVLSFWLCKIEESSGRNLCFIWRHVILGCLYDKFSLSGIFLDSWTISLFNLNFVVPFKNQGHDHRHLSTIYVFLDSCSVKKFLTDCFNAFYWRRLFELFCHYDSLDAFQSLLSWVEPFILWPGSSSTLNLNV